MEETNNRKPASKAFVLSLFTITIILILLLFFIFCKMMPRGGFDIVRTQARFSINIQAAIGRKSYLLMSFAAKTVVVLKSKKALCTFSGDTLATQNGRMS